MVEARSGIPPSTMESRPSSGLHHRLRVQSNAAHGVLCGVNAAGSVILILRQRTSIVLGARRGTCPVNPSNENGRRTTRNNEQQLCTLLVEDPRSHLHRQLHAEHHSIALKGTWEEGSSLKHPRYPNAFDCCNGGTVAEVIDAVQPTPTIRKHAD